MPNIHTPALLLAVALLAPSTLSAAIETWSDLDGVEMKAEYIGRKGDYVSFKKADGSRYLYPYAKLKEKDRARVDALALTAPSGGTLIIADEPSGAEGPRKIPAALGGNLVALNGDTLRPIPREQINRAKYVAFYYSAKWCPPCRAFTPELVKAYAKIKAKHPEFELVFVSNDNDAAAMTNYMKDYKMTFPAVSFAARANIPALKRPANERGIPNLVFMDADGKELSHSYDKSGGYLGPQKVLADMQKHFGI